MMKKKEKNKEISTKKESNTVDPKIVQGMEVLYVRVSSQLQNTSRQKTELNKYDWIVEDKVSGSTPFFDRPGGREIKALLEKGGLKILTVHSIDRMFRDAKDMMNVLDVFNSYKVPIHFISESLKTLKPNLEKDPIVSMIIHITGIFSELTRENIRTAQAQGIAIAKAQGKYHGRLYGSTESTVDFLTKDKNAKALGLLEKGYMNTEVAAITGLHRNTVAKIKSIGINY